MQYNVQSRQTQNDLEKRTQDKRTLLFCTTSDNAKKGKGTKHTYLPAAEVFEKHAVDTGPPQRNTTIEEKKRRHLSMGLHHTARPITYFEFA